jgi:hypothetical protein
MKNGQIDPSIRVANQKIYIGLAAPLDEQGELVGTPKYKPTQESRYRYLSMLLEQSGGEMEVEYSHPDTHDIAPRTWVLEGVRITHKNKDGSFDIGWEKDHYIDGISPSGATG